jgi:hypothetical protein
MYGDTYQQSYSGKNLAQPLDKYTYDRNGSATIESQSDGSVVFKTSSSSVSSGVYIYKTNGDNATLCPELFTAGYTVSFDVIATGSCKLEFGVTGNHTTTTISTTKQRVSVATATGAGMVFYNNSQNGATITISNIQVEAGSTATSFEPYVGGQPSPNPDYPQPIQTVTGEQTVEIVGKNLFDKDKALDNYFYTSTGSKSTYSKAQFYNNEFVPTSNKITMSFSAAHDKQNGSNIEANVRIVQYDASGNFTSRLMSRTNGHTFTLDANTKSFILCVDNGPDAWFDDLQVEYGSTPTAYAPYSKQTLPIDLGTIELCKLGDYQDYIYKDGESWKLHKATHSVTLTGAEQWQYPNVGSSATFFQLRDTFWEEAYGSGTLAPTPGTNVSVNPSYFKSPKFYGINAADTNMKIYQGIGKKGGFFRIALLNAWGVSTVEQLKTWLEQNNVEVTYVLATATDTTITDTNLIDQLNALKQGGAEEGTTYIKVSATDPNLPAKLYVEAPKYD